MMVDIFLGAASLVERMDGSGKAAMAIRAKKLRQRASTISAIASMQNIC
jgi:hypothetical protein